MDRSGYARATIAPRPGMAADIPAPRRRPMLTMADMGMMMDEDMDKDMKHHGHMDKNKKKDDMGLQQPMPDHGGERRELPTQNLPDRIRHGSAKHGPGSITMARMAYRRLEYPGAGLGNDGWRVLTYSQLRALERPHGRRAPNREFDLHLTGNMHKYIWGFDGPDNGETETDLLYSRLVIPFWNLQMGVQYANEWNTDDYNDRWSAVIGFQGLAPYQFELDNALYVPEDGDVTVTCEAEYDLHITQRIVLQSLAELHFAAQDISERDMGAGLTDVNLDLRLHYEIKREFAPYIGIR